MTDNVVPLSRKVVELDAFRPHRSGDAACLACGHTWVQVAPIGEYQLQCPRCMTARGVWSTPHGLSGAYQQWHCLTCDNAHMTIHRHANGGHHVMCSCCGTLHSIEQVFGDA